MSKTYQLFMNSCRDMQATVKELAKRDGGWMMCELLDGDRGWITTYISIQHQDAKAEELERNNVGVIHIRVTDDVAMIEASLEEPYEVGDGEYYAQTIPMLALVEGNGKVAYIPMGYERSSFYDQD